MRIIKTDKTPMQTLLGAPGEPPKCNQFIHWFRRGAEIGDHCECGRTFKQIKGKLRVLDRTRRRTPKKKG